MVNKYLRNLIVWAVILAVVAYFFLGPLYRTRPPRDELTYTEFLGQARTDQISEVTVGDEAITGKLKNGRTFRTYVPSNATAYLELLQSKGVQITFEPKSRSTLWPNLLSTMLPFLLLVGLWALMLRQAQSGSNQAMSFGRSRARLHTENRPKVTFEDVAGVDEAKEELQEIIEFLKHPKKFQALGAKIPRGVLLVGPPGSGKTLLAKAIAGEAAVPFFSISGSEFVEMFVGVGASVTGDTPVLIRDKQGIRLVPIGEFVDHHYGEGEEDFVVPIGGVETLGYEPRASSFRGRLFGFEASAWKRVRGVYRHKANEIFEIHYLGGILRATGDHSVFVRGHGGIKPKAVRALKPGDVLVDLPFKVRREFDRLVGTVHEIRAHRFEDVPPMTLPVEPRDEASVDAFQYAVANAGRMPQHAIAERIGVSQATVGHWQSGKHQPRGLSTRLKKTPIPDEVLVTPSLLKLFGYYTAEGRECGALEFCFGSHEKELIEDCRQAMRAIFDLEPGVEKTEDNATRLIYRSAALGRFFARYCGTGSRNKRVPELLWTLPYPYFLAYLEGCARGDGYTTSDGKLEITSVSRRLIRELAWLCAMHGIKCGVGHGYQRGGRIIKSTPLPDCEYWRLTIGRTSNPLLRVLGGHEHKKAIVQRVARQPFDGYVYDLCGCDNEAFFGGEKPVLLHNSRVRDLFDQAKKSAPDLVFIDEIDAVGRQRGAGLGGGHDEREQTLNQLLVEMDGFDPNAGIIVIAATNRPDILDPALLRPGRFDRRVVVDNPDTKGRRAILDVHVRGKPLGEDVALDRLAKHTPGFSGADLANLVNEAALLAARRNKKKITMSEMDEAIERVIAGPQRRSRILSPKEREIAAYHEGGHALLGKILPDADPPHKVTILPRGMALGYVISAPPEDKYNYTRSELLDRITVSLGGRVAEELVFGEVTTGAQNDFEQATELARKMVTEFGMSDKLGPLSLGKRHGPVFLGRDLVETRNYSEEIAYEIDKEIRRIIDECYERARKIIIEYRDTLERVAKAVLEKESLEGEELERVLAGQPLESEAPAQAPAVASPKPEPAVRPESPLPSLKPKPETS